MLYKYKVFHRYFTNNKNSNQDIKCLKAKVNKMCKPFASLLGSKQKKERGAKNSTTLFYV